MATRLYFTNTAAGITPTVKAAWAATASSLAREMHTTKAGSVTALSLSVTGASNRMHYQFVSQPILTAVTITFDVTGVIMGLEGSGAVNGFISVKGNGLYVTQGDDTSAVRGYLRTTDFTGPTEFLTSSRGMDCGFTISGSVSALVGDRIVLEIGAESSAGTTGNVSMSRGGTNVTDLTIGDTNLTTHSGWIQFGDDIVFGVATNAISSFGFVFD